LYYAIYIASRQQWVGFGDVKLGLALALLLADWRLAVLALFLANAIGSLLLLPLIFLGKIKRQTHVPFGPLLVAGWAIAGLFGGSLITWYLGLTLGV
jgi:leader peptidase (prepilin peptidase)/N-methyltransferase